MVKYRIKKGRGRKAKFIGGFYLSKGTALAEAKKTRESIRKYGVARTTKKATEKRAKSVRVVRVE